MKRPVILLLACLAAAPAMAQDEDGFSLMDEGARLFLRGLMNEIGPTVDNLEGMARELEPALRGLADEMGPVLQDLIGRIDDIRHYEAPVVLENGDILIRRSPDAPPYQAPGSDPPDAQQPDAEIPEVEEPDAEMPEGPIDL